ncbi:MAG: hypothetical protein IT287_00475 [Bdellovibrionaceae bacterium]|nr:hypothetical protein [Pseudobdellovibrionaceae bacterium]
MKKLLFMSLLILSVTALSADKVLMAVLVKVDKVPLTTRDLQINQFMNEYDNILSGYIDKREPLKEMVWEFLLGAESSDLLAKEEINKDYVDYEKKFLEKVSADKLWKTLEVNSEEVKAVLYRRFAAKKLIQLKLPPELIEVSDQEIESYYALNKTQLGNRPLEDIKSKITKGLREKKAQGRLRDWVAAVTRSHAVVYMSGFRIQ